MWGRAWIIAGALCGAIAVSLGAFGAHGLDKALERLVPAAGVNASPASSSTAPRDPGERQGVSAEVSRQDEIVKRMGWFDTAVRYQMYHAFALVLLGILATRRRSWWLTTSGMLFLAGILLFSGLLLAMTFGGPRMLGAIVPVGGLALIVGWLAMAAGVMRAKLDG